MKYANRFNLLEGLEARMLYSVYDVTSEQDSGPGTLRAAITKSNASVNVRDTIEFHIPQSPGGHITITPHSKLPTITDPVTINGRTQNGTTPDNPRVQISGNEVDTPFANGLVINTKNTLIIGLGIDRFDKGAGIRIVGNSNGVYECFLGIRALNSTKMPNKWGVNIVDGSGNVIGANGVNRGNVISGNLSNGVLITGVSSNNTIRGNLIGTDGAGEEAVPNLGNGVHVGFGVTGNVVVGNTISGNKENGVLINNAHFTTVKGNNIGVKVSGGGYLPNKKNGIRIDAGGSHNLIGTELEPNRISWNYEDGICIAQGSQNTIRGNKIRDNGQLGIDLGNDGVTRNDDGDGDSGANKLLNYPLITSAGWNGASTAFSVTFKGKPNTKYDVDFYSNPVPDGSGFGEGGAHEGTFPITTNNQGRYGNGFSTDANLPNSYLTATITDPDGNTSEFSPFLHVENKKAGVPKLTIKDATIIEGNSEKFLYIDVSLSAPLNTLLQYEWNPANGTALRGPDYNYSGLYAFEPGETVSTIKFQIQGDTEPEMLEENFFVYLSPLQPKLVNASKFKSTVTIIDNDNTVPNAVDDFKETNYNTATTIDVLANDEDKDGDSFFIQSVGDPEHGTAEIVGGKIRYTPDSDFIGYELFKYRIKDQRGGTDINDVFVYVKPPTHIDIVEAPGSPIKWDLKVTGTGGNDDIRLTKVGASQGKVKVKLNGVTKGTFSFSGRIIVDGLSGNDRITVDHAITRAAWLTGGAGKDTLGGGGGSDAIYSDDGEKDQLDGGPGIDLLFKDNLDFEEVIA